MNVIEVDATMRPDGTWNYMARFMYTNAGSAARYVAGNLEYSFPVSYYDVANDYFGGISRQWGAGREDAGVTEQTETGTLKRILISAHRTSTVDVVALNNP